MWQNVGSKKIIIRITATILTLIVMMTCGMITVFAADNNAVSDLSGGPYSLRVSLKSTNPDGSRTGIKNAKLSIYQVASLNVKNTAANYNITKDFASSGITFEDMTAAESESAADVFVKIVKSNGFSGSKISSRTNYNGLASFSDLVPGVYLIMLDEYATNDTRYSNMEPFLALVPGIDKSSEMNIWIDNVLAEPKVAIDPRDFIDVDPKVMKKVEGKDNPTDDFTFELEAEDVSNPMPLGSFEGKKRIIIRGEGANEFGTWRYTEPGTYKYTIREIPGNDKNYKYDSRVYHLTDKVSYSGSRLQLEQTLVVEDGNTYDDGTAVFEFVNKYNKPGMPGHPKTGDEFPMLMWLTIMIVSSLFIIALVAKRDKSQ